MAFFYFKYLNKPIEIGTTATRQLRDMSHEKYRNLELAGWKL